MVLVPLVQNMALIIVMALLHQQLYWRIPPDKRYLPILSGFLFGLVGIIGMLNPFIVREGLYYDGRSIVLAVAGVFGGLVPAAIAAAMCGTYRLALGGAGAVPAIISMVVVGILGSAYHNMAKKGRLRRTAASLAAVGFLVHAAVLAFQFLLSNNLWRITIPTIGPIILTAYPLVFLVISLIFVDKEKQYLDHRDLLASEARYRALFEENPAVMFLLEHGTKKIMNANPAAAAFYGWTHAELTSMRLDDIEFGIAGQEVSRESVRRHRTKNGKTVFVEVFEGSLASGSTPMNHVIIQDVTSRELAYADRTMLYKAIDKSFNEIYIFDADTRRFKYVSRGARDNLGFDMATLIHMTPMDLKKEMQREVFESILEGLRTGEKPMALFRTRHFRADGTSYPVEIRLQYFHDPAERVYLAIVLDITERVESEKAILALTEGLEERVKERTFLLEQANKELESFSYSISHDLRTPLRAIDNFSSLLQEKLDLSNDAQAAHYLDRIHKGIDKMAHLIDDLLRLSRIGRQEFQVVPLDIAQMAREILADLQAANPARIAQVSIPESLPGMGDRHMAKILLENLIGNAWKFTSRKAETRIEIGEIPRDEGAQGWYVKDNGAGFDPGQSGLLFMPFHRLHTDQEFSGSGIGLSIAHRIVVRHGGKLWAEAELGQGACFYFTLGNFTLVNPGKTHP